MTTIVYCPRTNILGADTRMSAASTMIAHKIAFPRPGVVLATSGYASVGEWLINKIKHMSSIDDIFDLKYKHDKEPESFGAFLWWGKPYFLEDDLNPIPIIGTGYSTGTGGEYALAYVNIGFSMQDAIGNATLLDSNSGIPVHTLDLSLPKSKLNAKSVVTHYEYKRMAFVDDVFRLIKVVKVGEDII